MSPLLWLVAVWIVHVLSKEGSTEHKVNERRPQAIPTDHSGSGL